MSAAQRWSFCFLSMAVLHAVLFWTLLRHRQAAEPAPPPPAIMIDMAPLPEPPAPPKPQPVQKPQIVHTVQPKVAAPSLPSPAPVVEAPLPAAPTPSPQTVEPVPLKTETAAPRPDPAVAASWQGQLLGRLEQFKRYPPAAQMKRQQGVVQLRFAMDRTGKVLSATIEKSAGSDLLDQEALALLRRAAPLPPPPPEVAGDPVELVVPVQFFLR